VPEPVHQADVEPALVALGSKLSHEPTLGESSENSVPAGATATSQATSPDDAAERLASGLARAVSTLVNSLPPDAPAPAALPPIVPIPLGGSSPAGEGFSGGPVPSGGASETLPQLFGVFDVLSLPLLKDSERPG
jgi:hypothetical protein